MCAAKLLGSDGVAVGLDSGFWMQRRVATGLSRRLARMIFHQGKERE